MSVLTPRSSFAPALCGQSPDVSGSTTQRKVRRDFSNPAPFTISLRPRGRRVCLSGSYKEPAELPYYKRRQWLEKVKKEVRAYRLNKIPGVPHSVEQIAEEISRVGTCWKSHEELAEASGKCEKTAQRVCDWLEEIGLLTWVNRTKTDKGGRRVRTSNLYTLILDFASHTIAQIKNRRPVWRERSKGLDGCGISLYSFTKEEREAASINLRAIAAARSEELNKLYLEEAKKRWKITI